MKKYPESKKSKVCASCGENFNDCECSTGPIKD
jgi:hypothetical protein